MKSSKKHRSKRNVKKGYILLIVLLTASIGLIMITGLMNWTATELIATRHTYEREQALQIAEAGIDYYRWHLAHAPTDFQDGTGTTGPYIHPFYDKDGNTIGEFSLEITPPTPGSTVVALTSGGTLANGTFEGARTIDVQFAKPSIAKYALVSNANMSFGASSVVVGPIHSNNGIRFDGIANNVVSSALSTYNDPSHSGADEHAVHTHVTPADPLPPTAFPIRPDIFRGGRTFPVPAVDFAGITSDLSQLKIDAQADGFYRPSAGALGYHIVLRTDDTFDLYRVTNLVNAPSNCTNTLGQSGWGTWSIQNQHLIDNYPLPSNGIIFLEDDIFVDGHISGARLNIIAAFLPDNPPFRKNIIINNDLLYSAYDGSDTIGLIAQGNVLVGLVNDTDLRIDGALIAQNGFVGRFYYRPPGGGQTRCSPNHSKTSLTLWGMLATYQQGVFAYSDSGFLSRSYNYDASLLYAPPPGFPLTSDEYVTLSWEEH